MAARPIIFAMANPDPEIPPERGRARSAPTRSWPPGAATIRTRSTTCSASRSSSAARSTCGATEINEAMKRACAAGARRAGPQPTCPDVVLAAYGAESLRFGPDYIIPKPFDPRLILRVAPAVAQAAMDSGVARGRSPTSTPTASACSGFVFRSGLLMKPVFDAAARAPRRVVFAEGEAERVLHCAQQALLARHRRADPDRRRRPDRRADQDARPAHRAGARRHVVDPNRSTPRAMPPTCTASPAARRLAARRRCAASAPTRRSSPA